MLWPGSETVPRPGCHYCDLMGCGPLGWWHCRSQMKAVLPGTDRPVTASGSQRRNGGPTPQRVINHHYQICKQNGCSWKQNLCRFGSCKILHIDDFCSLTLNMSFQFFVLCLMFLVFFLHDYNSFVENNLFITKYITWSQNIPIKVLDINAYLHTMWPDSPLRWRL